MLNIELCRLFNGVLSCQKKLSFNESFDARNNYMPNRIFFDLPGRVDGILERNSAMKGELTTLIKNNETTIRLSQDHPDFVRWQKRLEDVAGKHLINSINGAFFCNIPIDEIR
jgi:hypothetical protein